ncbi:MAG TPA: hydrogenase expression/formation protein HypE [Candidatus Acidoferrales bacterium]|nr:hydrogenase expression/formation protein HypE [Candidatus Acidoferrales bacterium]
MIRDKQILLGHGSGGKLMHELIEELFQPALFLPDGQVLNDAAVVRAAGARLAMTTDSFVVDPIFFPGGDIGAMAVFGTVNDLAVSGARPLFLSAAFILEEGLPIADLSQVVASMRQACAEADVRLITGDTKVVDRGKGDKVFINTTGIGIVEHPLEISADRARPGDKILLNGPIAAHGVAIMLARENIEYNRPIVSDSAPLNGLVRDMLDASLEVHCMRDLTRGGLAGALNEIAAASHVGIRIYEDLIPIQDEVRGACEILGLDPLHVANEGKLIAIVSAKYVDPILASMQQNRHGQQSAIIGEVVADQPGRVLMKTTVGGYRIVDRLAGEQLPRIC